MRRRDHEEIIFEWRLRESEMAPELRDARLARDVYNLDITATVATSAGPEERISIANFPKIAIDGLGQRIASVEQNIQCYSAMPGDDTADALARDRTLVTKGWWQDNGLSERDGRTAREFVAYGLNSTLMRLHPRRRTPIWEWRDPLATFPAATTNPDEVHPPDCIWSYVRSWGWVLRNYPDEAARLYMGDRPRLEDLVDLVEYADDGQHTLLVVGRTPDERTRRSKGVGGVWSGIGKTVLAGGPMGSYGRFEACVLRDVDNLAGIPLGVVPNRTTLDRRQGVADQQIPIWFRMQRLSALEDEAIDRGVFPEEWLVNPQGEARVVVKADGRAGVLGEITGGQIVSRDLNPGYRTTQALAALERMVRVEGDIVSESTGESPTQVRTALRGNSIIQNTIGYDISEARRMLNKARQTQDEIGAALSKAYASGRTISLYVTDRKGETALSYDPAVLFADGHRHRIFSPSMTEDSLSLAQKNMQKVGARLMARQTAMEADPDIDAEQDLDRMVAEELLFATLDGLKARAAAGEIPEVDIAYIGREVKANRKDLYDAIEEAQKRAQERQAQQVEPSAPEAQPGIANPGMGAEAPVAEEQGPPPMEQLMARLRGAA